MTPLNGKPYLIMVIDIIDLPHPENYIHECDALTLDYFPSRSVCKSRRIDTDTLTDPPIYSHAA